MTIYVLTKGYYSYEHIVGAYSTLEGAKAQISGARWIGEEDNDPWMLSDDMVAYGEWTYPVRHQDETYDVHDQAQVYAVELDAPAKEQ